MNRSRHPSRDSFQNPSHPSSRSAMRAVRRLLPVVGAVLLAAPVFAQIPASPADLHYPPLDFQPPQAESFRHELLVMGVPVYMAPSKEIPLVNIDFTFKGGSYLEKPEQAGLGSMLGAMMRRGGTESVSPDDFDEQLDFLAADVSAFVGNESSGASLNCLEANFDEAFALFVDMLRHPGFDKERLRVHKDEVIERFKQRNDNPMSVAQPEMRRLLYGPDSYLSREATAKSIDAVSPESMRALHDKIFQPGNLIIAVTGDFDVADMLRRLEGALGDWPGSPRVPDPPAPANDVKPGLYHARTSQADLPQGTALLLQRSVQRDDPDAIALQVMNDILGGGGFTSRITNSVRSDEGLAYTAVSFLNPLTYFPGVFGAFFQSKNDKVALAAKLSLEEIERIREEPVTPEELERTKNSFIEQFPQAFASKEQMLSTFVNDELTGRDPGYWQSYRDKVRSVTADDVERVAKEHLHPDEMAILIVGDWNAIEGGDLEGRASMKDFYDGKVQHLPVRDPLTREPVPDGHTDT